MEQHNAATEIDRKITETADSIGRLTSEHASFRELKTQWESLADLIEQKRKLLYTAPDVSFYLDQFFACATMDERRAKAAELAEDILAFMNRFSRPTTTTTPWRWRPLPQYWPFFARSDCPQPPKRRRKLNHRMPPWRGYRSPPSPISL